MTFTSAVILYLAALVVPDISFDRPQAYDLDKNAATQTGAESLTAGDFDNDCLVDIAIARWASADVLIMKNNGKTFSRGPTSKTGARPVYVVSAHLNGDNLLDLVTANDEETDEEKYRDVTVLINNGEGGFSETHLGDGRARSRARSLVVRDLDKKGGIDVACLILEPQPHVRIWLGDGKGSFRLVDEEFPTCINCEKETGILKMASGDLNGDQYVDLVVPNGEAGTVSILFNDSHARGKPAFKDPITYKTGTKPNSIAIDDLNDDRHLDVLVTTTDGLFMLIRKDEVDEAKPFQEAKKIKNSKIGVRHGSAIAKDLDCDGDPDLAVVNSAAAIMRVISNNGKGGFEGCNDFMIPDANQPLQVIASDFDKNGAPDLAVIQRNSNTSDLVVFINALEQPVAPVCSRRCWFERRFRSGRFRQRGRMRCGGR